VLRQYLPPAGEVLEIASGSGEHAVWFAAALPGIRWRPSDPDPTARASIDAWRAAAGLANLQPPAALDAADAASWPGGTVDAVVCINMLHISPWTAAQGLMAGAGRGLPTGGRLILYGPFREADVVTAPGNLAFDADLKARNPAWGLRDLAAVIALAAEHRLERLARIAMPANNLSLVFQKAAIG
jgi:SAM-dependent methyltransferase